MYRRAYSDIDQDDFSTERENEAMAFDHAIAMMREGEEKGMDSLEAVKAGHFVRRLWLFLLNDLGSPENGLPDQLRADLISIGIWALKEVDRIERREVNSFADLIDIMQTLRDGLK